MTMRARLVLTALTWMLFSVLVISVSVAQQSSPADSAQAPREDTASSKSDIEKTYEQITGTAPPSGITSDSVLGRKPDTASRSLVYTMVIEGAIGTVTDHRIEEAIKQAEDDGAALLVIYLDTPGGFTKPTWAICKNIMNSAVPVCMYIAPSGARAGSAGVYMTYSSHIAAMAPSTNIGAAHPVGGGGQQIDSVMNEKVTNDAVAQITAAAKERGRNVEWAERAVRESVSIDDRKALELNVVDLRARNLDELLDQINGTTVKTTFGEQQMNLGNPRVEEIEMSWWWKILSIVTQPDIALILFSIGSLAVIIELYNPGAIVPGVVGAICLILAFYSFQTLPINYAGLALIILSIILFILEIKIVSHGILTLGGLVSFFFGGIMLIDTVDPELKVSKSLLITIVIFIGLLMALVLWLVVKAHRRQVSVGDKGLLGKLASVRPNGFVYVEGALWRAESDDELQVGEKVEIVAVEGLTLKVKKQQG